MSLALPPVFSLFPARCGYGLHRKFRTYDDRRPSKFIALADNMRAAINKAWEHGGADFQSRFDQFTAQETAIRRKNLNYLPSFPLAVPKSLDISTTRASERG